MKISGNVVLFQLACVIKKLEMNMMRAILAFYQICNHKRKREKVENRTIEIEWRVNRKCFFFFFFSHLYLVW